MADNNRNREHRYNGDRSHREGQHSHHYDNYGGAYSSDRGSPYSRDYLESRGTQRQDADRRSDSEWDRDEYRRGDIWEREQHVRSDREERRRPERSDTTYIGGYSHDDKGRGGWQQRGSYEDRPANYDRQGGERDWWDRSRDEVSSWFGDDDAERRRRMDEQRSGAIHRGKGPKGYRRSEERIREDAYDRLTDDDRVDATNIQVQIEGDEVVLTGSVHSREEKRRAEDLVERVSGVRNVQNRLRVERDQSRGTSGYDRERM